LRAAIVVGEPVELLRLLQRLVVEAVDEVGRELGQLQGLEAADGPALADDDVELAPRHRLAPVRRQPPARAARHHAPAPARLRQLLLADLVVRLPVAAPWTTPTARPQPQKPHRSRNGPHPPVGQRPLDRPAEEAVQPRLLLRPGQGLDPTALLDQGFELGIVQEPLQVGRPDAGQPCGHAHRLALRQVVRGDQLLPRRRAAQAMGWVRVRERGGGAEHGATLGRVAKAVVRS
jgi:hypothetical protein